MWTEDEVDLLLSVILEYKISKTAENINWETCQSKYSDILDLFLSQYPSPENAAKIGKGFPHKENELTKVIPTSKMKAIRTKFRAVIDSARKSGHGRVVLLLFDICQDIWGGPPATITLPTGIETIDIDEHSVENSILCQSSTSIPSTPGSRPSSVTGHCGQLNTPSTGPSTPSRSSTPLTGAREYERSEDTEVNALEEGQDQENKDPMGTLKERRDLLNARLKGYMQEKLKRKLTADAMLLNIAQEDMEIKKRIVTKIEDMDKQQAENMKKMITNMEQLTSSIVERFAMLRQVMLQPCAMPPQFAPPIGLQGMYERMPGQHLSNSPRNIENDKSNNQFTQILNIHVLIANLLSRA